MPILYFLAEEGCYLETLCDPVQNSIKFWQEIKTDSLRDIWRQIFRVIFFFSNVFRQLALFVQYFDHTPIDKREWSLNKELFIVCHTIYAE